MNKRFDSIRQMDEAGQEFWSARNWHLLLVMQIIVILAKS